MICNIKFIFEKILLLKFRIQNYMYYKLPVQTSTALHPCCNFPEMASDGWRTKLCQNPFRNEENRT